MVAFPTAVSLAVPVLACAMLGGDVAAAKRDVPACPVAIEHICLATYPRAECTKIHVYLKNRSHYPVLVEGIHLGDRYLDLDPAHWSESGARPLPMSNGIHGHGGHATVPISEHADSSVQWYRALPNPIEPMGIGGVTISLWGTVKDASIRISLRGADELRLKATETKPSLRLSHVAFNPANPNTIYVYCENKTDKDIAIDHLLVNAEKVGIADSIPSGNCVKANKKSCFIIHPRQKMMWGKYAGIGVVGKDGQKVVAVVRVINYFPIGSWSVDTRPEMFFDSTDLYKPLPDLKKGCGTRASFGDLADLATLATVGRPYQAFYDGRDPTCDAMGWQKSAERIIHTMGRLNGGCSRVPYYTHVCTPFDREYAFFAELPDLTLINPYTILYRPVSPWESGVRVELARTWADPRPVIAIPEAFCGRRGERDLSPNEISFAAWNEVAAGAKGVRYFTRNGKGYAQLPGVEARMARDNLDLQLLKGFLRIGDTFPLAWASDGDFACKAMLCGEDGIVLFLFNKRITGGKKSMSFWTPQGPSRFGAVIPKGLAVNRVFHVDGGFCETSFRKTNGAVEFDLPPIDTTAVFFLSSESRNRTSRSTPAVDATHEIGLPGAGRPNPREIATRYKARVQKLAVLLLNPSVTMERKALIDLARRLHLEKANACRFLQEFGSAIPNRGADRPQKLFDLTSAYLDMGLDDEALAVCRRFFKENSAAGVAIRSYRKLSAHALGAGHYRTAIRCLELASNLAADRETRNGLLVQLVELYDGKLRHPKETLKWIEVILETAGDNRKEISRLRVRAAQLCLETNCVEKAMRHLLAIERAEWVVWDVDYYMGCAFAKSGRTEKAIKHLRSSVAHRESRADEAQFLVGWLLLTGGKRPQAIEAFRRLEERFPTSSCIPRARALMTSPTERNRTTDGIVRRGVVNGEGSMQ